MAKILVVDDAKALLELFSALLKMQGFEVATAASKEQLESVLVNFSPDLILLDVRLNGHNGRNICKEIKAKNEHQFIPIILISASPELLYDYEECGAVDVIEKPFELVDVLETINRVLNKSMQQG